MWFSWLLSLPGKEWAGLDNFGFLPFCDPSVACSKLRAIVRAAYHRFSAFETRILCIFLILLFGF